MRTVGVGGADRQAELATMESIRGDVAAITDEERKTRINRACELMAERGIDALYLDASTSLYYFTGLRCHPSERLHGAIITRGGDLTYLCPTFEVEKIEASIQIGRIPVGKNMKTRPGH